MTIPFLIQILFAFFLVDMFIITVFFGIELIDEIRKRLRETPEDLDDKEDSKAKAETLKRES